MRTFLRQSVYHLALLMGFGVAVSCDQGSSNDSPTKPRTIQGGTSGNEMDVNRKNDPAAIYVTGSRESMVDRAKKMQATMRTRKPLLERERDRQGKLSTELMSNGQVGCFADAVIEKLEVRIEGSWLGQIDRGTGGGPRQTESNAYDVTFQFADQVKFVNNEKTTATFTPGGRVVTKELNGKKISDLKYLKIIKGGVAWSSVKECENPSKIGGLFGKKPKCKWRHYELDGLQLDGVKIMVNDEVLYQHAGIEGSLTSQKLIWEDAFFSTNSAYIKLMQRTDCGQEI